MDAAQKPIVSIVKSKTKINGLFCDIYDRLEESDYSSARGKLGTNSRDNYSSIPSITDEQILVHMPVQMTNIGDSNFTSYDARMTEELYLVYNINLVQLKEFQKVSIKYGKKARRDFEIFKIGSYDGTDTSIICFAYLSPFI
jgi:hypothetical protein